MGKKQNTNTRKASRKCKARRDKEFVVRVDRTNVYFGIFMGGLFFFLSTSVAIGLVVDGTVWNAGASVWWGVALYLMVGVAPLVMGLSEKRRIGKVVLRLTKEGIHYEGSFDEECMIRWSDIVSVKIRHRTRRGSRIVVKTEDDRSSEICLHFGLLDRDIEGIYSEISKRVA